MHHHIELFTSRSMSIRVFFIVRAWSEDKQNALDIRIGSRYDNLYRSDDYVEIISALWAYHNNVIE